MRVIERLRDLAATDAALRQLREEQEAMDARRQGDPSLPAAEAAVATLRRAHAQAAAAIGAEEVEQEALRGRLGQQERALYDGSVRHPADLQRREHELATLRERLRAREDALLEQMAAHEELGRRLAAAVGRRDELGAQRAQRLQADEARRPELAAALAEQTAQRAALAAAVPAGTLRLYAQTAQRRTPAVVAVVQGACGGCRLPVPTRLLAEARGDSGAVCENCERLLLA